MSARGKYESELRKALLLLQEIARDDTHASAKAGGFLAGLYERLGWFPQLGGIQGECRVCGKRARVLSGGRLSSHYPNDPRFAYYGREGFYCQGSDAYPALKAAAVTPDGGASSPVVGPPSVSGSGNLGAGPQ